MSREQAMLESDATAFESLMTRDEEVVDEETSDEPSRLSEAEQRYFESLQEHRRESRFQEPRRAPYESGDGSERARKVARMKFSFYTGTLSLILANLIFFALDHFDVVIQSYWFVWPLALSLMVTMIRYFKAFILKGRSLQGFVDGMLKRMEEKELRRTL